MSEDGLVPLRTGFDVAWRGYRRDQVQAFVDATEADLRLVAADRDAALRCANSLAGRLEAARRENTRLRARLDRVCRQPLDLDSASDRMRHLVDLAHEEAAEIVSRARAVETEHRGLLARAREQAAALARDAAHRRRELDAHAQDVRDRIQLDFDLAMSKRRAEALRALDEREAAARDRADRIVRAAEHRAAALTGRRDRAAADLRAAAHALTDTGARLGAALTDA